MQRLGDGWEVAAGVVEDAVEQQPYAALPARRDERIEVGVVTEPGIDPEVIDGVVAMGCRGEHQPSSNPLAPSEIRWSSQASSRGSRCATPSTSSRVFSAPTTPSG